MKIIVDAHKITLEKDEIINAGEYNIQECKFEFSEEYDNLVKVAIFSSQTNSFKVNINDTNKCIIPYEVLENENIITIGVYGYEIDGEELIKRYSPSPEHFKVEDGSYKLGEEVDPPSPSIIEQIQEEIERLSEEITNVDIDAEQTETGATITITDKDGTQKTVELYNGEDGEDGVDGYSPKASVTKLGSSATITIIDKTGTTSAIINDGVNGVDGQDGSNGADGSDGVSLQYNWSGTSLGIKREDEQNYDYVNLKGDTGATGSDGNDGANATINGVNTLTIEAGSNISLDQQGSTMTISATGGSGGTASVIYKGKISQYDTSAKALDITNYPANTRILLKHNDSSYYMYIKFKTYTQQIYLPAGASSTNANTTVLNNLYYLDINSISSSSCSLAFTWTQVYEFSTLVSIFKGVSYNNGWTVNNNQYTLVNKPTIAIKETSAGVLSNDDLLKVVKIVRQTLSKEDNIQAFNFQLIYVDGNICTLNLITNDINALIFRGTFIDKNADTNGFYTGKRAYLRINFNSSTYAISNYSFTTTKLGYIFDETTISGYDATETQTLKNVNGTLTWVTD